MLFYCCTTADILTKHLQQCFLIFIVGNSQVSVYRTIGPTLFFLQKVELLIGEKFHCWPLKRVWKKVLSQGKVSEKSRNLDIDIEWQP